MSFKTLTSENMNLKASAEAMGVTIPDEFLCPLTSDVMKQPLMTRSGMSFEREAIIAWLQDGNLKCPVTRKYMNLSDLIPNKALEKQIAFWRWDNMLPEPKRTTEYPLLGLSTSPVVGIISPQNKKITKALYRQMVTKVSTVTC